MTTKPRIALWDIPPLHRRRPEPDGWTAEIVWQVVRAPRPEVRNHIAATRSGWTSVG